MPSPYGLVHFCWSSKNLLVLIYSKLHSKSCDKGILNRCLFHADIPQNVDDTYRAICFADSCILVRIQPFRPRIAVRVIFFSLLWPKQPRFQGNIPSINLVSQQTYRPVDGILLASSKFGQRRLVMKN